MSRGVAFSGRKPGRVQTASDSGAGQEIKVRERACVTPPGGLPGGRAESGEGAKMRTALGQTLNRTITFSFHRKTPTMDSPSPSRVSQAQPAVPSPLTSYHWHTGGGGEKGAGGFRWGRLAGWGRTLSHQEPMVSSQPAPRSLFRRVLSAPPKESRTSRLRLSKTLWGKHKSPPLEPEPEPEATGTELPRPGWEAGCLGFDCLQRISPTDTGSCGEHKSPTGSGWGPDALFPLSPSPKASW